MSDSDADAAGGAAVIETHAGPCPWCDGMVVDGECSREGCEFETTPN